MMRTCFLCLLYVLLLCGSGFGQESIYTKDGRPILNRKQVIANCLKSFNKDRSDKTALAICECQVAKIDKRFSYNQYKRYTNANVINLEELIKEDSLVAKDVQACFVSSGRTFLLQAESAENAFVSNCIKSIQQASEKSLNTNRLSDFCKCQLQMVKTKRLSDADMSALSNPNSVLFYDMMYTCGDPFVGNKDVARNWTPASEADVKGAINDTIPVLNLNGMTYVRIRIGGKDQVWLLDTGASDLLINTDMEADLHSKNIINQTNYLGIGEYELANGTVDTCRKYKINNIQIGNFTIDNVIVAVTEKGKRIIAGKALLNKFKTWSLNNQQDQLILSKE